MPQIEGITQNSPEWFAMRTGCFTASGAPDLMARYVKDYKYNGVQYKAGDPKAERRNYVKALAIERLTGRTKDTYLSPEMIWGMEQQDAAAAEYCILMGVTVIPGGLWAHDSIDWFMASPDYLVRGLLGALEAKCPATTTHLDYIVHGGLVEEYWWQCQAQMSCCKSLEYVDLMSYDPRVPEKYQRYIRRVERDKEKIRELEGEVIKAKDEVVAYFASLENAPALVVTGLGSKARVPEALQEAQ